MPATDSAVMTRADMPNKGTSMADVEKRFGAPSSKQPTVGGETAKHPPITRWDYPGFSIIFEKDKVVDAVIPGAPPEIFNKDELSPTASAPPMPGAAVPAPAAETVTPVTPMPAPVEDAPEAAPPTAGEAPMATPENPNPDQPR